MDLVKKMEGIHAFSNNHLHLHTDASLADGAQSVREALDKLKEIGATAAAITDHGVCCNWLEFYNYANKIGIKPILGVEAYIETNIQIGNDDDTVANEHLVLLAKDYKGFQQISRFVSRTNHNLKKIAGNDKPVGTMDMLRECFGPDAKDSGHTICQSACIGGPLAQSFFYNFRIDKEIGKIERRIKKIEESFTDEYYTAKEKVEAVDVRKTEIDERIKHLTPVSKKKYGTTERKLKKMPESEEKELLANTLAAEKFETEHAINVIADLRAEKKALAESVKDEKKLVSSFKQKLKNIEANKERIAYFENARKTEDEMKAEAISVAKEFLSIFGEDFYAEVQYHGIKEEAFVYPRIADVARELQIPIVATNDAHMAKKEDITKRSLMVNSGSISRPKPKWRPPMPGDEELYIKTGQEMADALIQILPEDVVEEAMQNIDIICNKCSLTIDPSIKHYPKFKNAKELLRAKCEEGIKKRFPNGMPKRYYDQMEYELGIIDKMGYNDYFCMVIDFIEFAKKSANHSIEIGPGRGSGAGSVVCYLTGITELDPMRYDLMFERFLNPERVSMPKYWAYDVNYCLNRCVA